MSVRKLTRLTFDILAQKKTCYNLYGKFLSFYGFALCSKKSPARMRSEVHSARLVKLYSKRIYAQSQQKQPMLSDSSATAYAFGYAFCYALGRKSLTRFAFVSACGIEPGSLSSIIGLIVMRADISSRSLSRRLFITRASSAKSSGVTST